MEQRTNIQIERPTLKRLKEAKVILMKSKNATYDEVLNELMSSSQALQLKLNKEGVKK